MGYLSTLPLGILCSTNHLHTSLRSGLFAVYLTSLPFMIIALILLLIFKFHYLTFIILGFCHPQCYWWAQFYNNMVYYRSSPSSEIGKLLPMCQTQPIVYFIGTHSHVHSFSFCLWWLLCYNNRIEQLWPRTYGLQSTMYLFSSPLLKKVCWCLL